MEGKSGLNLSTGQNNLADSVSTPIISQVHIILLVIVLPLFCYCFVFVCYNWKIMGIHQIDQDRFLNAYEP